MAKVKMKVYPFASVSAEGKLEVMLCQASKGEDSISEYSGNFYLHFPMMEIEIEVPEDFRPACVALLRSKRDSKRAAHAALMTKMQFQENQLLGLAAPEILDRDEGPRAKSITPDDDFPF